MDNLDLNLLIALDALLTEGSVTGAGRRLGVECLRHQPGAHAAPVGDGRSTPGPRRQQARAHTPRG